MAHNSYAFRAVDTSGVIQKGTVVCENRESVVARIRAMGLRPVSIGASSTNFFAQERRRPGRGGKRADALAVYSRQFATMIAAGTPIVRCLEVLSRQCEELGLKRALEQAVADIQKGSQLSEAMERQPQAFNEFYISMIRAGESSGTLDAVLDQLAIACESVARLRRKIRSAMAYPAAVAVLIAFAVLAMLTLLVPSLADIFAGLHGGLPLPTQILMAVSNTLVSYFPIVMAIVIGAVVWFKRYKKTPDGRLKVDRIKLRMPVLGKMVTIASQARFSRSLAVLTHTGVPMVQGLQIAATTANNRVIHDSAMDVAAAVSGGQSLAYAMEAAGVFDPIVVQMVLVGEETGALDELLENVAEMHEQEVNTTIDSLTSLLEPLLITVMGITVGGMLLAVYMPMFKLISLVK